MKKGSFAILCTGLLCVIVMANMNLAQRANPTGTVVPVAKKAAAPAAPAGMPVEEQQALIKQYCMGCHSDAAKSGGIALSELNLAKVETTPELAEKVIRQLKGGMMPKGNGPKPAPEKVRLMVSTLENTLDRVAALKPNPGSRPFQRLTRTEYARSVKDLLGIDVDVEALLPADQLSDGLDNIADSQPFSATLMEGYMRAAARISRDVIGDPKAEPDSETYKIPRTASQVAHVEGAPMGTRGGISVIYNFPADGEYELRGLMHSVPTGGLFGQPMTQKLMEQLEFSVDGERVALKDVEGRLSETLPTGLNVYSGRVTISAGAHRVSAAFLTKHSELVIDNIAPQEHTLADTTIGSDREITTYPHLREFEIKGPFNVTGVSDTPTRRRVFMCRPLNPSEELPCATKIVTDLAKKAYRRGTTAEDLEGLMSFYERGRKSADFEAGIRSALEAILVSPNFVFRLETVPATVKPGQTFRIADLDLASRLSYFLWNTFPDDELLTAAKQGRLKDPLVLEKQVRRMLADPRSDSLSTKFAGQWLHLADLANHHPDGHYYSNYDYTLAVALQKETELFFNSIVKEDRNVMDLMTADHSFVNERLARHYGIPNVRGPEFRRVTLTDDYRKGLLGKGAILALTSVAERTSPVVRGKWVMGVLLGTPPPPPPPAVPKLEDTEASTEGKILSVRERMEAHRANPSCNSCHQMIDPIGIALENFDNTGAWRTRDITATINSAGERVHTVGVAIDASTKMHDGTPLNGPASLRAAIVARSGQFIQALTEKMMAYATGRRTEYFDMPTVRKITRDAAKNNNRFSAIVLGIVNSPAFQYSKAEAAATTEAAKQNQ